MKIIKDPHPHSWKVGDIGRYGLDCEFKVIDVFPEARSIRAKITKGTSSGRTINFSLGGGDNANFTKYINTLADEVKELISEA